MEEALSRIERTIREHREVLATEEAAKNALVMPFLQALGYNVFNPGEVVPEFTADIGRRKGEKVDYAICNGDDVRMLVECKPANCELKVENATQLYRYFSVTKARVAILTNGVVYRFYADIDEPNIMDSEPFFTCRLDDLRGSDAATLQRFSREEFDIEKIVAEAKSLKLQSLVRRQVEAQISEPSDDLVRIIAGKIHEGRLMPNVLEEYRAAIRIAFMSIIRERLNERLSKAAMDPPEVEESASLADESGIETTEDEVRGRDIIRAIGAEIVSPERIDIRDAQSYCAILLDDNNRRTIARLRFNSSTTRYLGTFSGREETQHRVEGPVDIYQHREAILARIRELTADS